MVGPKSNSLTEWFPKEIALCIKEKAEGD